VSPRFQSKPLLRAAVYRGWQVVWAVSARWSRPGEGPARELLSADLYELYDAMPVPDRRHALAVLQALQAAMPASGRDLVLLQAALLHDVGKSAAHIRLWHRITAVLLAVVAPRALSWLAAPQGWRRPWWVLQHHAALGAEMVAQAGGSEALVLLIRHHQGDAQPALDDHSRRRLSRLRLADARS
jgi:putative nucleotidyltransferase with HDIG domain